MEGDWKEPAYGERTQIHGDIIPEFTRPLLRGSVFYQLKLFQVRVKEKEKKF